MIALVLALAGLDFDPGPVLGCVAETALTADLDDHEGLHIRLEEPAPGRVTLRLSMAASGREAERTFELRRLDCALIPRLVARVWERFLEDIPPVPLAATPGLRPVWPARAAIRVELAASPGLAGAPRLGTRLEWSRGPAGSLSFALAGGFDSILFAPLGDGQVNLHALWFGAGAAMEGRALDLPWSASLILAAGAQLAVGAGFEEDRAVPLPVARLRVAARVGLPGAGRSGLSPEVGVAVEGSAFDLRLTGPGGPPYREPWARIELLLGLAFPSLDP